MRWLRRDPFEGLSQLPDDSRVGWRLILGGLALGVAPFAWLRLDSKSFQHAGALVFRADCYLLPSLANRYSQTPYGLIAHFAALALACLIAGVFIFCRKGVWWVAEHRADDKSVTQLGLK